MGRLELIHRRTAPPRAPAPPRPNIYNTVHQTVVHLHQINPRQIHRQIITAGCPRKDALPFLLPPLTAPGGRPDQPDPARPIQAARALIHIFSKESAKRELRPFFGGVVRGVLREERERYKSRPARAVSLLWVLFGQPNTLRILTRFYLGAAEKLGAGCSPVLSGQLPLRPAAGALVRSHAFHRSVHQFWNREVLYIPLRYSSREGPADSDLLRLPAARRAALPPREVLEQMILSVSRKSAPARSAPARGGSEGETRLSEADFRALVRGVTGWLERRNRLESLQKGGALCGKS